MPDSLVQERTLQISSKAELAQAAADFLAFIGQKRIILFEGEMAAGKTTFIKAICAAKGVEDHVSSPTFALVNEYEAARGQVIYHFDFYRIDDPAEALDIGVLEYFHSGNLCLIEWPSKIENLLPEEGVLVTITTGPQDEARTIQMRVYGGNDGKA